jgi:hypothetical protein
MSHFSTLFSRSRFTFLVGAVLAGALCVGGCGPGDSPSIDPPKLTTPAPGDVENGAQIVVSKVTFDHEVGKTQCPQMIGTITLRNVSNDKPLKWTITKGDPLATPATGVSATSGTLAKGQEVVVNVVFNCSQTFDVSEQWIVNISDDAGNRVTDTAVNIKGKVKGG